MGLPVFAARLLPDPQSASELKGKKVLACTVIGSAEGVVVATHLWWTADGPADDPYAPDRDELRRSRERVLALADLIIPGHGGPFRPAASTPR